LDLKNSPVLTTVLSSALSIEDIEFPAVTICGVGSNNDVFRAAVLNQVSA
jgi:hypothetical protein